MKKWYIKCPFCANEIKEWAIKCQFCEEFLNKGNVKKDKIWEYRKIIVSWIIVVAVIGLLVLWIWYFMKQKNVESDLDMNNSIPLDENDSNDTDELKELYDTYSEVYTDLSWVLDKYYRNLDKIWELFIDDANDYNSKLVITDRLDNRRLYKDYSNEYLQELQKLSNKYKDTIEDDEYLSKFFPVAIDCLQELDNWADINIEHYAFLSNAYEDFYVTDSWRIAFYDNDTYYYPYYKIIEKMDKENDIYNEKYDKYVALFED